MGRLGQAAVVGVMCGVMVVPPGAMGQAMSAGGTGAKLPVERHVTPLTEQERMLQALNRFTFGPRPGDVAAVESMGLQRWFEMQLHPERVDDSGFEAEMREFPAMGLPEEQLKERFPSVGMIRRMEKQGAVGPSDPVEKAIYADAEAVYAAKVEGKNLGGAQSLVDPTRPQSARTDGAPYESVAGTHPAAQSARVEDGAPGGSVVGISPEQVEAVLRLAPEDRLGRLVAMTPEQMLGFREAVKGGQRVRLMAGLAPAQREAVEAMVEAPERVVASEDQEMRLMRDIDSKRQLQAVMTEFWLNHFNVYLRKNQEEPYLLPAYEQETVLPHALGKFEDLLVATAKSPAMLMYLDNWESVGPNSVAASYADGGRLRAAGARAVVGGPTLAAKSGGEDGAPGVVAGVGVVGGPTLAAKSGGEDGAPGVVAGQAVKGKVPTGINENYARELMELHTLGVGGGYTQQDVIEVAKCFTGWTIDRPYAGGGARARVGGEGILGASTPGEFAFDARRHEPGSKVVLGHVIAEGGMNEGLEVLHLLATSPATAHFISQELAVRFVSDRPPAVLVNRMAATYLKTDGDISAVLETMFRAKEFWAPGVYRAKVKTPLEFLASAVRASGATVGNALPLVQAMDRLGMPVWGMQTPNGWGWTAEDWVSSNGLLGRMNFALLLSGNKVNGTVTDWGTVLGAGTERELEVRVLGQAASERTRAAVMAEVERPEGFVRAAAVRPAGAGEVPVGRMAGLLMGSPEFQRR